MPNNLKKIDNDAFYNCTNLASLGLSNNLEVIGEYAIANCTKLETIEIPEGVNIGSYAFEKSNLKTVTFKGKPLKIGGLPFNNCYELKTINVPWSEGEVAGAPWGAGFATINYNYTE